MLQIMAVFLCAISLLLSATPLTLMSCLLESDLTVPWACNCNAGQYILLVVGLGENSDMVLGQMKGTQG